jgi:hypothetical protein
MVENDNFWANLVPMFGPPISERHRLQALDQRERHERLNACDGALHSDHQRIEGARVGFTAIL